MVVKSVSTWLLGVRCRQDMYYCLGLVPDPVYLVENLVKSDYVSGKRIPIVRARELAKQYGHDQMIILGWDQKTGRVCITTYGKDKKNCDQAALGGKKISELLGLIED